MKCRGGWLGSYEGVVTEQRPGLIEQRLQIMVELATLARQISQKIYFNKNTLEKPDTYWTDDKIEELNWKLCLCF